MDWQQYTASGVHTETVPGDHLAVVQGAHVHARVRAALSALDLESRAPGRVASHNTSLGSTR